MGTTMTTLVLDICFYGDSYYLLVRKVAVLAYALHTSNQNQLVSLYLIFNLMKV